MNLYYTQKAFILIRFLINEWKLHSVPVQKSAKSAKIDQQVAKTNFDAPII